jgi:hypothetical protein
MQKLNLPEYSFRIKTTEGKEFIFDSLRKKFVRLTPEEWVSRNFVQCMKIGVGNTCRWNFENGK